MAVPADTRVLAAKAAMILDGIVLIFTALFLRFPDVAFSHLYWSILYLVSGVGLLMIGTLSLGHTARAFIAGLAWLALVFRGAALFAGVSETTLPLANSVIGGMVWIAFGTHIILRIAYWPILEQR